MSFAVPRSSRRTSGVGDYELTDTARNIGTLLRFGQVLSVDYALRTCRVQLQENLQTDNLPWITMRAGGNAFWSAPSVDETVLILSPSGELNNAVVLPALQTNENGTWPFNFSDLEFVWGGLGNPREALWRWLFADGAILENDPEKNQFRVEQQQTRIRGAELAHLRSEKFIYIEADSENDDGDKQGIVHVKAPMIKLDGDVHITGKLLQSGDIVGVESDGEGLSALKLIGDPIELNGGGGVLGLLASLVGAVAGGALSLGQLGTLMNSAGGSLLQGLGGLAENVLGSTGLGELITQGLTESGIGAAMAVVGDLPVLGEVFNAMGFTGNMNLVQGAVSLVQGVTSGSGLKLTGIGSDFAGLASFAGHLGESLGISGLSNLTDSTALSAISNVITNGTITINDVMGVAATAGSLVPGNVGNAINTALSAANVIVDGNGNTVAGPQLLQNAAGTIMNGLLDPRSSVSAEQIAHKISEMGLATSLEALEQAGVNGGQGIGELIGAGAITLEQVLDLQGVFQDNPDAVATAVQSMDLGGEQEFFATFERKAPGGYASRDMSSSVGSDSSPKKGSTYDAGSNSYIPDGSGEPLNDAYADWNTNYA